MTDRVHLLDVNVLVALAVDSHLLHGHAHRARSRLRSGWATSPVTESALIRLVMNPAVTSTRFTIADALAVVAGFRADPAWQFLDDATTTTDARIDWSTAIGHRQITDFHLVDLAARHGAVLATFDAGLREGLAPGDRRHVEVLPLG